MATFAEYKHKSSNAARSVINRTEGALLSIQPQLPLTGKTAGELIVAAHSASLTESPLEQVKAIRAKAARELHKAKMPLKEARKFARQLATIADAIEYMTNPPADADPVLSMQARTAIAGAKAGIVDNIALAATIRDAAREAHAKIDAAEKSFRVYESTVAIVAAKGAAHAYRQFRSSGLNKAADALEAKAARLKHLHRVRFPMKKGR